jgi:hypothetical protein
MSDSVRMMPLFAVEKLRLFFYAAFDQLCAVSLHDFDERCVNVKSQGSGTADRREHTECATYG